MDITLCVIANVAFIIMQISSLNYSAVTFLTTSLIIVTTSHCDTLISSLS